MFGPTYGDDGQGAESSEKKTPAKKKEKAGTKRKHSPERKPYQCAVCERYGCWNVLDYWYYDNSKAPEGWIPRKNMAEKAKKNLEKPSVQKKIQDLQCLPIIKSCWMFC